MPSQGENMSSNLIGDANFLRSTMNILLIGFGVYFTVIALIALTAYTKNKQSRNAGYSEIILGNRSVNYVLTALSAHASDMSDWLFMAFPGALYAGGLIEAWIAIGLVAGMWFTWHYIAPQLRKATEKHNCYTLSTYFEQRFSDTSGSLRLMSALISCLFFTFYIAAGLKYFGYVSEEIFHLPYTTGIFIALICLIFYIVFGGYRTLAWIDSFQALFLLTVIFFVPYFGFLQCGSWHAIVQAAAAKQISLSFISINPKFTLNAMFLALSWAVGYFGMPHILTKFMGISDVKQMNKAKYIGLTWQIAALTAAGMVGFIGIAYFSETLQNPEFVFINMVLHSFSPLWAGFILSSIAGATLSVVTAQVLVLVSVFTEDLYKRTLNPLATDKELVWIYRASILVIALLSFFISLITRTLYVQQLVSYAWMGFGSAFGPLVILSLYSKRINLHGAQAALIVGTLVSASWTFLAQQPIYLMFGLNIPSAIPGFMLSIIAAYTASYATKNASL